MGKVKWTAILIFHYWSRTVPLAFCIPWFTPAALLVGIFVAVVSLYNNKFYFKRFRENGNRAVPEARLSPMMIGGIMFAGELFLFGCGTSHN